MIRRRIPIFIALLLAAFALHANPVEEKNFPLLALIERTPAAVQAIASDPELAKLHVQRQWSEDDIATAANALKRLYASSDAVRKLTDGPLRASHAYVRFESKRGGELLAAAWSDAAHGIDDIIDVYANGKPARYPAIDAPSFDVKSAAYAKLLHTVDLNLAEEHYALFFQPSLAYALQLLALNDRDEAGRHEPLDFGVNAGAIHRITATDWKPFPYSVIVVPGYGPDKAGVRLSPEGRLRIELAARRYKQGKAPFILVSGGYVHPSQTPYCEALEMKAALITDYGVPADAIIADPHARHTTTNLRNAARLMSRYGVPFDHKALITTDTYQSEYIEGEAFTKRCNDELGYQPAKILGRVSPFDLEFTPRPESLQVDPKDPLDP